MSEKKTININPDLFKVTGGNNTTRKQKQKIKNPNKIHVKENREKKPKQISTIKRNILKMIRNQQMEKKKKPLIPVAISTPVTISTPDFQNDFQDTLEYLSNLTKETETKLKNQTIRNYPTISPPLPSISLPLEHEHVQPMHPEEPPIHINKTPNALLLPPPKYGCLKNGSLPTYRSWLNQTRKTRPPIQTLEQQGYEKRLEENIKDLSRIQQQNQQQQNSKIETMKKKHFKEPKQKRILRRTFYVGRSRVFPKVSVLVANKTIRANTQLKTQQLKQIPMTEVKHYLLKNGFIKIGTNAPNDVLREMYENAQMICGEIKNHNPENLLYNYFNDTASNKV